MIETLGGGGLARAVFVGVDYTVVNRLLKGYQDVEWKKCDNKRPDPDAC